MKPRFPIQQIGPTVASLLVGIALIAMQPARADVRLPRLFTDNMMLQRDRPIRVWGWADPGETVTVAIAQARAATKADAAGFWTVELPAMSRGEALEMTVSGRNTVRLVNLIIGDIWLCAGQSNMEMGLGPCTGAADDIKAADYPTIRRIKFKHVGAQEPLDDAGVDVPWQPCTPKTAPLFSAVGFYFARDVVAETGVPIGLLDDNWGGTRIERWIPAAATDAVPELAPALAARKAALDAYRKTLPQSLEALESWIRSSREALESNRSLPSPPAIPPEPEAAGWFGLYNAMIHPVTRLPIKGILWYQGESNAHDGDIYLHKMRALVAGWRTAWQEPELPFYFVQLASYQNPTKDPAGGDHFARLRESQRQALSAIPDAGMAVIIDTVPFEGALDGHPKNKFDPGARLAKWALHRTYGRTQIVPSGPLFKAMQVEGPAARISFDHVGAGLMVGKKSGREPATENRAEQLAQFAVAGEDRKWHWADAAIDGDTVVVSSPEVGKPAAVRYAFSTNPDGANLYNRDGLPASPFRTDSW